MLIKCEQFTNQFYIPPHHSYNKIAICVEKNKNKCQNTLLKSIPSILINLF